MKRFFIFLAFYLLILIIVFRSLIFHVQSHLLDWLDYPYYTWIIFQNIEKIKTLNFVDFFNTNAFYPNKLTLFFSDTLIPQSIIALPFSLLAGNPILVFNLTFIATFILNYVALFLFWRQIFKKNLLAFLGSLFVIFSPFFHLQLGHFQTQSYWPFFFALYFLFKSEDKKNIRNLILAGIFLSIQFLSGVYLAVFWFFCVLVFYTIRTLSSRQWNILRLDLRNLLLIVGIFVLLCGIFIKGYLDVKRAYAIRRDYREYISYSAHLSDYLFTTKIRSILHNLPFMNYWNSFDKHLVGEKASFPGFLLSVLTLLGLFSFKKSGDKFKISLQLNKQQLFFLAILFFGFLFSLGPRLNFNGAYAHIPTPYNLFLKSVPLLDSIRTPARWSFLFYLGITYFSLTQVKRLLAPINRSRILVLAIFAFFVFEYIPLNTQTQAQEYKGSRYEILKKKCVKEKKTLLEIPVTHFKVQGGIAVGLNYISKVLLSSLYHQCYLINGYSGYLPTNLLTFEDSVEKMLQEKQGSDLVQLLSDEKIDLVKFNSENMLLETRLGYDNLRPFFIKTGGVEVLDDDIFRIKY